MAILVQIVTNRMKITVPYALDCFARFNELCFGNSLPEVPVVLTSATSFLGRLCYRKERRLWGSVRNRDFQIRLSSEFDLGEREWEDVIIHEMIHLHIASNSLKDTSSHGRIFHSMMDRINAEYGRSITVSHRSTPGTESPRLARERVHCVCVSTFPDGRKGVTVCSPAMAERIDRGLPEAYVLSSRKWYITGDKFFNRFPHSRLPRIYRISCEDLAEHLSDAVLLW